MIARVLFFIYNYKLLKINDLSDFIKYSFHGISFDTTSILYVNSLFIILSTLPLIINVRNGFQQFLFYLYFITNFIAFSTNFIDFIYYRYSFNRSTRASMDTLEYESNKTELFLGFLVHYWHVFALLILCFLGWIYLYKKIKLVSINHKPTFLYFLFSKIALLAIATLCIGGIRGDFQRSTRPINLLDASRFVTDASQADFVLNTPFAIIRTWNTNTFKKVNLVSKHEINELLKPIKKYQNNPKIKPNIVIFILESYGKEYISSFNKDMKIPNHKGYSPFVDSLAQHSLIFTNAYANGWKSIHGMSSVLAGIPSFKDAFTSSAYSKQKIESLVSTLKKEGYDTSFFHGAPNGSMGFLGFGNILGFDHYYGKSEYNNDADFDGFWGIWDEPFFQYFDKKLSKKKGTIYGNTIFGFIS